jgi:hypothetical protein
MRPTPATATIAAAAMMPIIVSITICWLGPLLVSTGGKVGGIDGGGTAEPVSVVGTAMDGTDTAPDGALAAGAVETALDGAGTVATAEAVGGAVAACATRGAVGAAAETAIMHVTAAPMMREAASGTARASRTRCMQRFSYDNRSMLRR